jgi:hypothetical protein
MNRRSFITKALVGIAAIPLIGKLAQAMTPRTYAEAVKSDGPVCYFPFNDPPALLPAYRKVTITFTHEAFFNQFPNAKRLLWEAPPFEYSATLQDDNGDHQLKMIAFNFREYDVEAEAIVVRCRDATSCRLGCIESFSLTFRKGALAIRTDQFKL